ncbi:hypothetical protein BGZ94_007723 [Podila epigama]|nr:hypothetical protein BGZ94_007723 [Podila epigama]
MNNNSKVIAKATCRNKNRIKGIFNNGGPLEPSPPADMIAHLFTHTNINNNSNDRNNSIINIRILNFLHHLKRTLVTQENTTDVPVFRNIRLDRTTTSTSTTATRAATVITIVSKATTIPSDTALDTSDGLAKEAA